MKTYHDLARENRYLYEKAENCTLMMGLAIIQEQDSLYKQYKDARADILAQVSANLDLIETIWNKPLSDGKVIKPIATGVDLDIKRECAVSESGLSPKSMKILSLYEENKYYSATYIANEAECSLLEVKTLLAQKRSVFI